MTGRPQPALTTRSVQALSDRTFYLVEKPTVTLH